jgi:hypothetical protein
MKNFYTIIVCASLLPTTLYVYSSIDQDFDAKLNMLQQSITMLVTQADVAPEVAQEILTTVSELNQYAQSNIQQDIKEIRVAAGITSILETADKIIQNMHNMHGMHTILSNFKYAARANTIHKLLIGAYPGRFKDQEYYTNPYAESVGFILNNWLFAAVFQIIANAVAPTSFGKTLSQNTVPKIHDWIAQIAAGITAHYAWLLQKKLAFQQPHNDTQSLL